MPACCSSTTVSDQPLPQIPSGDCNAFCSNHSRRQVPRVRSQKQPSTLRSAHTLHVRHILHIRSHHIKALPSVWFRLASGTCTCLQLVFDACSCLMACRRLTNQAAGKSQVITNQAAGLRSHVSVSGSLVTPHTPQTSDPAGAMAAWNPGGGGNEWGPGPTTQCLLHDQ